jgi:uncharacterized BrkB/YihY/UPF0761 family membrane protein
MNPEPQVALRNRLWSLLVLFLAGLSPAQGGIVAHHDQNKEQSGMRLKLVIAASALAAVVGAGFCIALVLGVFSAKALSSPNLLVISTLLLPTAAIVFASIFVYRHTARRRKLQAFLTAILATLLTLGFFVLASILSARGGTVEPTQPVGPHIAA